MKNLLKLITCMVGMIVWTACSESLPTDTRSRISLEGNWGVWLDTAGIGCEITYGLNRMDSIYLPGTTDIARLGRHNTDTTYTSGLSREYFYEGRAWYMRRITIPAEWEGTTIRLFMERTKPTGLWIDSKKVGTNNNISTPQQYDLSVYLTPGEHTLAICVDNSAETVPEKVFHSSHAYSASTQTNWNGILGKFYLESAPMYGIEDIQVYPNVEKKAATVSVSLRENNADGPGGKLSFYAEAWNTHGKHRTPVRSVEIERGLKEQTFKLDLGDEALLWSEFSPALYRLTVSWQSEAGTDTQQTSFGLRSFTTRGTQFVINGKTTFLRGKHDACVFPLTAHTAMDVESWQHYFRVAKEYGINHYRFHSWCPPEACFEAADREGIYLQPELPVWGHVDIKDTLLCDYLLKEGRNLHRAYGNHASFVMFALGNEMSGEEALALLIKTFKQEDSRHLYASGSNNYLGMRGKQADEQYFTTCRVGREAQGSFDTHARASFSFADAYDGGYLNHTYPNSTMDFSKAAALCDVPVVGHETGQYQVYPDYEEIRKYSGVLKPYNMEVFRQRLEKAGMGDQAKDFLRASGKWSALLYRADIEMNLRTPQWGGFQLLDLQDYPGQGSAYVGILNAFMESKGLITPEEWRNFCNEVVPLFCTGKFCWSNNEQLSGEVRIANYSADALKGKQLAWTLTDSKDKVIDRGTLPLDVEQGMVGKAGTISPVISSVRKAEKVCLTLSIDNTSYRNSYPLWVYPADNTPRTAEDIHIAREMDAAMMATLKDGGKVLWFPSREKYREQTVDGLFQTDYWNYRMFKTICENMHKPVSPGTLGILTDPSHAVFADFPTDFHTDWQWFSIIKHSYPLILDRMPADYRPIVQVIDNVERNHKLGLLFEFATEGGGKLLVCMADLKASEDKPEVRQFYGSLLGYMASSRFNPACRLTEQGLRELFSSRVKGGKIEALGNISYE